jgi:hypothetical protein
VLGIFYSKSKNLVRRARSEMIGSAVHQICSWVSGVRTGKVSGVSVQVSAIMSVISEALTLKYGVSTITVFGQFPEAISRRNDALDYFSRTIRSSEVHPDT